MRHLLLTEQWYPNVGGSIHLFDEIYCQRFPPGELVHVVAGDGPGAAALDAAFRCPVTRFNRTRYEWMRPESLAAYARMASAATRTALRAKVDVVHCARVIPEGIVARMIKRAFGIPYVLWVHGEEVSMYLRYWGKRALMPEILREARAVICNSSFSRAQALRAGAPPERLHVVHPCVEAARFRGPFDTHEIRQRFGLAGKTVVTTVGRLTRRKGHDHVLHALARLRRKDVVHLVLSDGELGAELRALVRTLHLEQTVRFVGQVEAHELPRYYAASDVFIMANRTLDSGDVEGFGMVFLEASAAGLPVIGGRSGGAVDAIEHGETGLLVDGGSIPAIAEALQTLLDDPALRARLGARGRERMRQHFAWEPAAHRVRQISEGLPPDARPRPEAAPRASRVQPVAET
jgi:phosphatidylinositol alpha-1,6-mannosyltransferase